MDSTVLFLLVWAFFSLIGHSILAFVIYRFANGKQAKGELQKFSVKAWVIMTFFAGFFGLAFFVLAHGKRTS